MSTSLSIIQKCGAAVLALTPVLLCFARAAADEGIAKYEMALTISPFVPSSVWDGFGELERLHGWLDEQVKYSKGRERQSQALATLAYLCLSKDQDAEAAEFINRAIRASPTNPRALIIAVLILRTKQSIDSLQMIPAESEWHEDAVLAHVRSRQWEDNGDAMALLSSLQNPKPYAHLLRAFVFRDMGEKRRAISEMDEYLRLHNTGPLVGPEAPYVLQADMLYDIAQYQRSVIACRKGLEISPRSRNLRLFLVRALCKLGEGQEALNVSLLMAKEEPNSFFSDYMMAESLLALQEWRKALVYLKRMRHDPDVAAETVHSISHVCLHCGDFKQAVAYIQEFTEAFPKRSADGLVFQAAVCECYLDSCTEDRRQALKGILQDGVNRRLCCIQHVLWAVGAVHNMGDSALARELADTIQKSECSTADLLLLERLQSALAEGSALNYQALK